LEALLKIAYFTESVPPLTDGVARTYTRLAETLNSKKIDFRFFAPVLPTETEPWRGRVKKVPSVPFPLYRYYRVGIPYGQNLDLLLDRFQPDLIQVAAPTPLCIYGQNYAFRKKLPVVASYHTHFVDYFPYYGFGWATDIGWQFMQWFFNRNLATFAPTPGTVSELVSRGFQNVQLWPRGIDGHKFSPDHRNMALRKKLGLGKEPLLLFVGRMVGEKDLADLAQAALILRQKGYKFQMAFAGDGPYRTVMEKQFPRDHFFGFIQGRKLSELYASSDLFVFPSTTETFGNVVLEAFASGLPVIGVRKGGVADLVQDRANGFLARPNHPQDFARRIQFFLDHPAAVQKAKKGALATAAQYDWPTINGRLISHYEFFIREHKDKIYNAPKVLMEPFPPNSRLRMPKTNQPKRLAG
jgi:glycosyltransferase involved in cell wall biosynthesis